VNNVLDEVLGFLGLIQDEELREKTREFFVNPPARFEVPYIPLEVCPAGAYQHHSYAGGLLEHTACVVRISLTLCDLVEDYYDGEVDRNTVVSGALLHDVMKCYCYEESEDGNFRTSDFGGRVDHLSLMVGEMIMRGFPWSVVHVVASHHGDAGATKPKTLEALIVSIADLMDSEFNRKLLRAAEYLLRRVGEVRPKILSASKAVDVVTMKDREGWDGLKRLIDGKG
jgi:7,8-dihydroneopterin 2',3'-cyclic phosphate phosphodiesterase